jgi:multiple RNA-binding domain-containing protein 1
VPDAAVAPADESVPTVVIAKKPKTAVETAKAASPNPTTTPAVDQNTTDKAESKVMQHEEAMEGVEDNAEANRGPVSDIDWLRSRTNRVLDLVEDDEQPVPAVPSSKPQPVQPAQPAQHIAPEAVAQPEKTEEPEARPEDVPPSAEVDKIRDTGRLYLRNLHFEVNEEELREHFSKYGSLEEVCYSFFFPPVTRAMMNV